MVPFKNWIQEYYNASFDFGVVDKVKVPDLPEGKYVLSWRWEPWISRFGRFSWEFCDSFRQTLLWMEKFASILEWVGQHIVAPGDFFHHFSISFNEDCEMTKQIWSNCADVTIKKSGQATKAFSPERGGGIDEVTIKSSE